MKAIILCLSIGILLACAADVSAADTTIPIDHANLLLAPYVWKHTGNGASARAEAALPGAYLKAVVRNSTAIGLVVDGTANKGCPASSLPVVEYCIDEGSYRVVRLGQAGDVYTLPLADHLDGAKAHRLEVYFRAADLAQQRWKSSLCHLRMAGLRLDAGGSLAPYKARPKRALGFGDSITEGVGVDGLFKSWQSLGLNNARATWLPLVSLPLGCEYGQLGSGGQGMTRPIEMPPLPKTWDHFDPATSRLKEGLLLPEPDYIFCCMGTNDFGKDITADYTGWLVAVRKACPNVRLLCVVPPLGLHEGEIKAAVVARNKAGDRRVHLIDTTRVRSGFRVNTGATQYAFDGVHPSVFGQAVLGALIVAEAQQALGNGATTIRKP
jgi:lysophospholipase L1-like esterase